MENISKTMVDQIADHVGHNIEINIIDTSYNITISGCLKDYDFDLNGLVLCVDDFNEMSFDLESYIVFGADGFDELCYELRPEDNDRCTIMIRLYF